MSRSKKSVILSSVAVICASLLTLSIAQAAIEGGNARKGGALAKEKCKSCHVQGAEGGTMTALSKTQRQWDRFFKKDKHEQVAPGTWKNISDEDLKDIKQFFYDHAADSDQPQTCGR